MKLKGIGRVILCAIIASSWANLAPQTITTPLGMVALILLVVVMFSGVVHLSQPATRGQDPLHE